MVSVIVVSYNCAEELRRCLSSLPDCEIIVVDNASRDGSADMVAKEFPSANLIRNETNRGFGSANNQGLAIAKGEFALLLNPDAIASPGAVDTLVEFLRSHEQAVACGGSLWFPDGRLQESASNELTLWAVLCEQLYLEKIFKRSGFFSPYWVSTRCKSACKVAQVMGACLMMRRIGDTFMLFDERFFLYCEDTELCKRISQKGEIWYVPQAHFVHALGASSKVDRWRSIAYYNRGKELFFRVHHNPVSSTACFLINRLGAFLRLLVWSIATVCTLGVVGKLRHRALLWARVLLAPKDPYTKWREVRLAASKASLDV